MNATVAPERAANDFLAGGGQMGALMRAKNWADTPLGSPETWPQSLKAVVRIMLSSRFAMWMGWGEDLTFFYNDAYRPTLGVKHDGAIGTSARWIWREIWSDIGPRIEHVLRTGEATWDEGLRLFLERSGYPEETYHTFSYSPLADDNGAVVGMLCVVSEETERVIGERRLASLRELASAIAGTNTHAGVLVAVERQLGANLEDLPFTLTYLFDANGNARLACATGVEAGSSIAPAVIDPATTDPAWPAATLMERRSQLTVSDLADRFERIRTSVATPLPSHIPTDIPTDIPTGAWDKPPREAVITPIARQGQDAPAGFLVAAVNPYRHLDEAYLGFINLLAGQIASGLANADAHEEERRRAEALAEIDRAKTTFFSNVSHEFRTPLTLMLGPLEEVLATPVGANPPAARGLVTTAYRNGLRLLKLVNSLLDFSRIEAGRVTAHYEPTDLTGFTAELASSFRSAVDKAGLRLVIDCPPLPWPVHVDRDMWEKIVLNLLSNAFKFTFDGEIAVAIRPSRDGSAAELTVRDTGTGIPAHELPRLFDRFHRVEGAAGRSIEGSGIGLALVLELVKLHGGTISVESKPAQGSIFTVAVPYGTAHLPPGQIGGSQDSTTTGIRARAYVEEALRWLPPTEGSREVPADTPSRSAADDLGTPRRLPGEPSGGRVLLADDNADMRDYVCRLLVEQGYVVEAVGDGASALAVARREAPDLVLSDVMMPGLDGFGLLHSLRADPKLGEVPVVLLSARAGEEARVDGLEAGADDYLTKPFSARELLARVGANLQMARMRREVAEALRVRTTELETVLATVPAAVWFTRDPDGSRVSGNRQAAALLRLARDANASLSAPVEERPDFRVTRAGRTVEPALLPIRRAALGEEVRDDELEVVFPDGTALTILAHATPLRDAAGQTIGAVCAGLDITARKQTEQELRELNETLEERVATEMKSRQQAEAALRQAQKMEAIGQLTGGVAHDFNNLLMVIQGNLETLDRYLASTLVGNRERFDRPVRSALRGVERAAALTHRLLAFARRQPLAPDPLEPDRLVAGMSDLLRRTLGESVAIDIVSANGLWRIFADPNQLENALLNLAVNARDAMPQGGRLVIETANTRLDETYVSANQEVIPGDYVMFAVTDTGTGMSKEASEKAFEPFFTTKEIGRGTGLGLSQVYGFVKQSGGHVKIYSEVGEGTTVRLYLPRYTAAGEERDTHGEAAAAAPVTGSETILVVEDDGDVRANSVSTLRELGYRVLEAPNGAAALQVLSREPAVRLLFTDVGLPDGMNGRQLAEAARERVPGLKVLFTTGYAQNAILHNGRLDRDVELIVKPYTFAALAAKIRSVLEAQRQGA